MNFEQYKAPRPAGYYRIGPSTQYTYVLTQSKRPRWLTRLLMAWLLEVYWEDAKEKTT